MARSIRAVIWSMPVGGWILLAIQDGWTHTDPLSHFPGSNERAWQEAGLPPGERLRMNIGCFVLTDDKRVVMVDSGMGAWDDAPAETQAVTGRMPEALSKLGIAPEAVETVVHTHLHPDHFGGDRTADGTAYFPNARLIAHRADVEYFRTAEGWRGDRVRQDFLPLMEEGRVDLLERPGQVLPGIHVWETPGHTPGHLSVHIVSGDSQALIGGDISHHPIQVTYPSWSSTGDLDPKLSAATRSKIINGLADTNALFAAGHYPPPGFGYVETDDHTRRFTAVEVEPFQT